MSHDTVIPLLETLGQIIVPVLVALIALYGAKMRQDATKAEEKNASDHARNFEALQRAVEGMVRIEAKTDEAHTNIRSDIQGVRQDVSKLDDKVDSLTTEVALNERRINVLEDAP